MRVCLLNDSFPPVIDGVANTVMNYARVLTDVGDTVMVATPAYPGADYSGYPYKVVPYRSIDTTKLVHGYRAGNPFDGEAIRMMKGENPDIIHTHCPVASTVMARILRNETEAPVIFTYHTKFDYDIARMVKAKSLQEGSIAFLISNISACDEVWTVSQGAGENLKSLGYKGEYRVMANGVDFAKGRIPDEDVQKATKDYDLPEDLPVYLFVGRLMSYKGLPIIIDAMKLLSEKGKDYRCVFVGGGADQEAMEKKAIEEGLAVDIRKEDGSIEHHESMIPGKLIFTGPIQDRYVLRAWNTRGDLFLFPSTYDTNGIVVREAAACGLASVLIRNSCAAEGITDGRNGFLIDENAASMAELLERLYIQRDVMRDAGQNAMDEIYLSWDDAVRTARKRYEEILELVSLDKFPMRKKEASDAFIDGAGYLSELTDEMVQHSRIRAEGMLSNFYNARSTMQRTADRMREAGKQHTREMKRNFQKGMEELKEEAYKGMEETAREFFGDGSGDRGQQDNQ